MGVTFLKKEERDMMKRFLSEFPIRSHVPLASRVVSTSWYVVHSTPVITKTIIPGQTMTIIRLKV